MICETCKKTVYARIKKDCLDCFFKKKQKQENPKYKEYLQECTVLSFDEWLKQGGC